MKIESSISIMATAADFHRLALFMCHLFIDGQFRTAHILYKPNQFDHEFLTHIDSECAEPMPLYLTDVTQSWERPWNQHDSPDNVLQLSLFEFDPNELRKDVDELNIKSIAIYQIFAFRSIDWINKRQRTKSAFNLLYRFSPRPRKIILSYDAGNVSAYLDHDSSYNLIQKPVFVTDFEVDFDRMVRSYFRRIWTNAVDHNW